MTTLVLQTVGGAVGGAFGGPIGAMIGRGIGAVVGSSLDRAIFGGTSTTRDGHRLTEMAGLTSTEGAAIPRIYGRVRLGGQIIWATRFLETVTTQSSGGGKGGSASSQSTSTTYSYSANFAVGLCEGPISFVRRIWANGKLLDWNTLTVRVYCGDEAQQPDPLIVAKEGAANAPAYRGLAYIVFEGLPLADFGNRVPQLSFEIVRSVGELASLIRSVNLIPGAGEFAYDTIAVTTTNGAGQTTSENRHDLSAPSDFIASLDQLVALCPNLDSVQLVVAWFGDDLRCGHCTIAPRVDSSSKQTVETQWSVNGLTRNTARVVSFVNGAAAYGGTPSDASVLRAIAAIKARGLKVSFYCFAMMDIPSGNALPDPHQPGATQAAFPWRGRITCDPAPGVAGSPSGTAVAAQQVTQFFGSCQPSQFQANGQTVSYSGPNEWSWRRMALHYATLCQMAGGVDAFIMGSELVSLTAVESAPGVFPAVSALISLANDLKSVLGASTKLIYSADWTEYGARIMPSGDVRFPLDALWASSSIDAIGIDGYWPLSDWRDGTDHADYLLARSSTDLDYLTARFTSGEAYEWYYASDADRAAQRRTPIHDGLAGKDWMWRQKDLSGWWSQPHFERHNGQELPTPTPWMPSSKPIWITEFGCPAVDRGANGPNAFPDPKSVENALPPFSRGTRDPLVQARTNLAIMHDVQPSVYGLPSSTNPMSSVYNGPMIDPARVSLWAWDARPFPAFPSMTSVWADAPNFVTGHWLNGRLEAAPLDDVIAALLADFDLAADDISVDGFLDGYAITAPSSARAALEPLAAMYRFSGLSTSGTLRFIGIDVRQTTALTADDVVPDKSGALVTVTRAQESELPHEVRLSFADSENDYRLATVASRRIVGVTKREETHDPSIATSRAEAQRLADQMLHDAWANRETASLIVRPGLISLEPGDIIALDAIGHPGDFRITRITDSGQRSIEAQSLDTIALDLSAGSAILPSTNAPHQPGQAVVITVDLPLVNGDTPVLQAFAAMADPWPGSLAVWRSGDGVDWTRFGTITRPATSGVTTTSLGAGPLWRWDLQNSVTIALDSGVLSAPGDLAALAGTVPLGLQGPDGTWEVIGFSNADLIAPNTWRLSRLLRGLGGSESSASRSLASGARVVVLDDALLPIATGPSSLGANASWRIVAAALDYMHPTAVALQTIAGGAALRPLSPVRAAAQRGVSGVTISFVRRARINADSWDPAEIPLDETLERYEIDILKNGLVIRTLPTSGSPSVLYPSVQESADFGSPQTSLSVVIYQISDSVGRGFPYPVTLTGL